MILRLGCAGAILLGMAVIAPAVAAGTEAALVAVGTGAGWGLALFGAGVGVAVVVLAAGQVYGTLYEAHTRRLVALAMVRRASVPHLPPPCPTVERPVLTGRVIARYDIDY